MKLTIYTDGASRGNPGPSSYGFSITNEKKEVVFEEGEFIGITTNNVAEYTAVLKAFQYLSESLEVNSLEINFFMDSKLVVEQLSGRFKIKSEKLKPIIIKIKELEPIFASICYKHVPRELNKQADSLANKALDNRT